MITLRLTGIEANAAQVSAGDPGGPPAQISAFVTATGPATISVQNYFQTVAVPSATGVLSGPSDPSLIAGMRCATTATPLPVDPAGAAEPAGDFVLSCEHLNPKAEGTTVTLDLGLYLNTDITNDGGTGPPQLLVYEYDCPEPPPPGQPLDCSPTATPTPSDGDVDENNRVVWRDVTFSAAKPKTIFQFRGLRADVVELITNTGPFPSNQAGAFLAGNLTVDTNRAVVGTPIEAAAPVAPEGDPLISTCQATAVPPVVRAEGIAELLGDIIITCENIASPNVLVPAVVMDFFVTLDVNVTNNIGFGPGGDISDAVLIVNENNCTSPAASGGVFGSCGGPDPRFQDPQYGRLAAPNRLEWRSVALPVPGAPVGGEPIECVSVAGACNPAVTTIRITSMRARASELGIPTAATFVFTRVNAFLAMSGESFSVQNNVLDVAVPIRGKLSSVDQQFGLACEDGSVDMPITIREGFATAFKTIGIPSFIPGQTQFEAGYFAPGSNAGGGASQSTRIGVYFADVPDGVRMTLPKLVVGGGSSSPGTLRLQWVQGANSAGEGGSVSSETDDLILDSPGPGPHVFFYEVTSSNPFSVENIQVPVRATWTAGAVAPGFLTHWTLLAPISQVFGASFPAPEPRFEEFVPGVWGPLVIEACPVPSADVRVELDASPNVAIPRRLLQLRARVTNDGPDAAEAVTAVVHLPSDLNVLRAIGPCTNVGNTWTCNLGAMASGDSAILQWAGVVAANPGGPLGASASVSTTTDDPGAGNDAAVLIVPLAQ